MFADLKKMSPFSSPKTLAAEQELQLDYEFPKKAKIKELLNRYGEEGRNLEDRELRILQGVLRSNFSLPEH